MFTWLVGRFRCLGGKHERSRKHAHKPEGAERYLSKCAFCGVPMERLAKREWTRVRR